MDEVSFNFMRRHQVEEETADIHLSELIKQNQERAARNMVKTQEQMRRKASQKKGLHTSIKQSSVPRETYGLARNTVN